MPPKQDQEATLAIIERQFAILRAIAEAPGLTPAALAAALLESTGRKWGMATLYKDIATLKERGLLDPSRNRQGYYLTGAGFADEELQVLVNGLRIQAEDLANPLAQELYNRLMRRAALSRRDQAYLSLAVEAIANRSVVRTSVDGFADVMEHLREPLLRGQRVGLRLRRNPWAPKRQTAPRYEVYPLQFFFHDVAWYLLAEDVNDRCFVVMRIDRINPAVEVYEGGERGSAVQAERQGLGRAVLRKGWGTAMPAHTVRGQLTSPLETFELRFAKAVAPFIAENQLRHDSQRVRRQPDGSMVFMVDLPTDDAVVFQFRRWILSWGRSVEVVGPKCFRERVAAEHADVAAGYARSVLGHDEEEMASAMMMALGE